jgi:hypothetical protein
MEGGGCAKGRERGGTEGVLAVVKERRRRRGSDLKRVASVGVDTSLGRWG